MRVRERNDGSVHLSMLMLSSVVCSRPCMISTTKMAMSHKLDPRERRLLKDSWPVERKGKEREKIEMVNQQ